MNVDWWTIADEDEWMAAHWIYEATVTVGENVYWGFIPKSEGLPWEQVG